MTLNTFCKIYKTTLVKIEDQDGLFISINGSKGGHFDITIKGDIKSIPVEELENAICISAAIDMGYAIHAVDFIIQNSGINVIETYTDAKEDELEEGEISIEYTIPPPEDEPYDE